MPIILFSHSEMIPRNPHAAVHTPAPTATLQLGTTRLKQIGIQNQTARALDLGYDASSLIIFFE